MDLTKLSVTELKALAYDALANIEVQQNNLRAVNAELVKRNKVPDEQPKEDPISA